MGRPKPRGHRPPGPAAIAPLEPESPAHRRELLKATYHRLARLSGVPCADLKVADAARLRAIAGDVHPAAGHQGDARRLVTKIERLRT